MKSSMNAYAPQIQALVIKFLPFLMAIVFHQFALCWMAHYWGDETAAKQGRLTLNPLPHIDPVGTLLLPILNLLLDSPLLLGWAKPAPIHPNRFRHFRKGLFWVGVSGPLMHFALALLFAAVFCGIAAWVPQDFYFFEPFFRMSQVAISLNFALGIFNLLPLYPLDGSRILKALLPPQWTKHEEWLEQNSFFIFLGLMFSGLLNQLKTPIFFLTQISVRGMGALFGLE